MGYRPYRRPAKDGIDPEPTGSSDPHPSRPPSPPRGAGGGSYRVPFRWDRYFPPRADKRLNAIVVPITYEVYLEVNRTFGSMEGLLRDRFENPATPVTVMVEVMDGVGNVVRREEYDSERIWG